MFMQDSFYMQVLPITIVINNSCTLIQKISYKYIASMGHSAEHSHPPPPHTQRGHLKLILILLLDVLL